METKILIADDKEEIRQSIQRRLKILGIQSDLVSEPEEAIRRARISNYGFLITDLDYTRNGREGYKVLHETADLSMIRILYTGRKEFDVAVEAIMAGADYVVPDKNESELMKIIEEMKIKEVKGDERK